MELRKGRGKPWGTYKGRERRPPAQEAERERVVRGPEEIPGAWLGQGEEHCSRQRGLWQRQRRLRKWDIPGDLQKQLGGLGTEVPERVWEAR